MKSLAQDQEASWQRSWEQNTGPLTPKPALPWPPSDVGWVPELLPFTCTRALLWPGVSSKASSSLNRTPEAGLRPHVLPGPGHRRQECRWVVGTLEATGVSLTPAIWCSCLSQGLALGAGAAAKRATLTF